MVDVVDRSTRSRMMAGIRGKNTQPEITVRRTLHGLGLRFRLHAPLPGHPDLVFPKYETAVFVHGCFWHRHPGCPYTTTPASNRRFWNAKFRANVARDARKTSALRSAGWRVLVIWACMLDARTLKRLAVRIRGVAPRRRARTRARRKHT